MQTAISACEPGGRVVLVGMGQEDMTLPMALASIREIDIYGSFRYCNTVRCAPHIDRCCPRCASRQQRSPYFLQVTCSSRHLHEHQLACAQELTLRLSSIEMRSIQQAEIYLYLPLCQASDPKLVLSPSS